MDDLEMLKLLPDLPRDDGDGTVERVYADQLSAEELEEQWKNFIANANALVDTSSDDRLVHSTTNPFDAYVPPQVTPLFARDAIHVRKGYRSQEMDFDVPYVVQELKACPQEEAEKAPRTNYAVEICPQGRLTTIQRLQTSVEHTLDMHKNMIRCLDNVVNLLDTVVKRLNTIDETMKEHALKKRKTNKEFDPKRTEKAQRMLLPKKLL
jgi:hypothetical protein